MFDVVQTYTKSFNVISDFSPTNIIKFCSTPLVVHKRTTWPSHTQSSSWPICKPSVSIPGYSALIFELSHKLIFYSANGTP